MTEHNAGWKVLLIAPGELWGGVEQCVLTLSLQLAARGRLAGTVTLFGGQLSARLMEHGIPTYVLEKGLSLPTLLRELRGVIEETAPSLLHAHGYKATIACALGTSRPLVRTVHGGIERGSSRLESARLLLYERAADMLARWTNASSIYVSDALRKERGQGAPSECRIHNGVDLPTWDGTRGSRNSRLRVGIVGRITPVKGHDVAIEAWSLLSPDRFELLVAGDGEARSALIARAQQLGVTDSITWRGFVADMATFYRDIDVLIMPSRNEGIPYALLEAMTYALPIIASDVGGIPEVITHESDGLLVPPDVPHALAASLERLASDPVLSLRLGSAARATAQTRFSTEHMMDQHMALYASLARAAHHK